MLDIQVHAVLRGTVLDLSHAIQILRMNSVEHQIDRRIRFSCEAQNSVGFVRPNKFTVADLPSEGSRMTQLLSLCQVLPSSLQLFLICFPISTVFLSCMSSFSTLTIQDSRFLARLLSISAH